MGFVNKVTKNSILQALNFRNDPNGAAFVKKCQVFSTISSKNKSFVQKKPNSPV